MIMTTRGIYRRARGLSSMWRSKNGLTLDIQGSAQKKEKNMETGISYIDVHGDWHSKN